MDVSRHSDPPKIYIYHTDHEHDRTYTENVVRYLESEGVLWRSITLNADGYRPELQLCLDDCATAVLGYNSQLDHSWLPSGSFLDAAERHGIPVLQWILDHPSSRWAEFNASTTTNSRFLLNSEHERQYFEAYCLPGALTATTGGVGLSQRSRVRTLTRPAYLARPIACMVPLSMHRVRSIKEHDEATKALEPSLAEAVHDAFASAKFDLVKSLQSHVTDVLAARRQTVSRQTFNSLCQLVEQSVQTFRRLKIFAIARRYPVLIQSDESATPFVQGSLASFETNVGMQFTLARMSLCRAVLSVSPMSGLIHDRTMNALNAGCVAIAEDNLGSKGILQHKENALLFRYDDDSLDECLDIMCNQPERCCKIAEAGCRLRDDPRIRFGQFHNIISLAQRRPESGAIHP